MKYPRDTIEPLPPELKSLISAAAGDDGPSEETRARLYGRLCATLALPHIPAPPGAEPLGLTGKAAALLPSVKTVLVSALVASGVGLAGLTGYLATRPSPAKGADEVSSPGQDPASEVRQQQVILEEALERPRIEPRKQTKRKGPVSVNPRRHFDASRTARDSSDPQAVSGPVHRALPATAGTGSKKAAGAPENPPTKSTMADERRLIEAARRALSAGDIERSITLLGRHRQQFGAGQLSEERDALYIVSLSKKGRHLAARRSARRFFKRYPKTVFKDAVEAALRGAP
jgi:hypothetical protein